MLRNVLLLVALLSARAAAQTVELHSVTIAAVGSDGTGFPCGSNEVLMSCPGSAAFAQQACEVGAGTFPSAGFTIRGLWLHHVTDDPRGFALIGETPPDGDDLGGWAIGAEDVRVFYPSDLGFVVPPSSQLHVHAQCGAQFGRHSVYATIFYTLP